MLLLFAAHCLLLNIAGFIRLTLFLQLLCLLLLIAVDRLLLDIARLFGFTQFLLLRFQCLLLPTALGRFLLSNECLLAPTRILLDFFGIHRTRGLVVWSDARLVIFPGPAPLGWRSRKFPTLIRLLDKGLRHRLFFPVRSDRNFLLPGLALAKIRRLRALLISCCAVRLLLARLSLRLTTAFLRAPGTELVQLLASAQFRHGQLGFATSLVTALAVAAGNLAVQRFVAFDFNGFHAALDPGRLEGVVPCGVDVRRGNHQPIALEFRTRRQRVAALTGVLIHLQPIERQRSADPVGHSLVLRPAGNDLAVLDVDVGDVAGLLDERHVAGNRQTVPVNRAAEVTDFDKIEPERTDPELDVHGGIPGMPTISQGLRRKRGPADVAVIFTP